MDVADQPSPEGPVFGTLAEVPLRRAWPHEAQDFTPWLAENLNRLSEVIGIPLELEGAEVAVESFAADILARSGDALVLIENQLYGSDHNHLGQIMTYLAGLDARTVIWIADSFREPHLSAVRWLNQHTSEAFSFFAVRLRVVRIGGSPLVPLFEVLERPNGWDRRVQETARGSRELTELGAFRKAFWEHLFARHAEEAANGPPGADSSRWRSVPGTEFNVARFVSQTGVGIFVRGRRGVSNADIIEKLRPYSAALSERLGVTLESTWYGPLVSFHRVSNATNRANWDEMADWLKRKTDEYVSVISSIVGANG